MDRSTNCVRRAPMAVDEKKMATSKVKSCLRIYFLALLYEMISFFSLVEHSQRRFAFEARRISINFEPNTRTTRATMSSTTRTEPRFSHVPRQGLLWTCSRSLWLEQRTDYSHWLLSAQFTSNNIIRATEILIEWIFFRWFFSFTDPILYPSPSKRCLRCPPGWRDKGKSQWLSSFLILFESSAPISSSFTSSLTFSLLLDLRTRRFSIPCPFYHVWTRLWVACLVPKIVCWYFAVIAWFEGCTVPPCVGRDDGWGEGLRLSPRRLQRHWILRK